MKTTFDKIALTVGRRMGRSMVETLDMPIRLVSGDQVVIHAQRGMFGHQLRVFTLAGDEFSEAQAEKIVVSHRGTLASALRCELGGRRLSL